MSNILEKLSLVSEGPGVYLMKDRDGLILYVGKASSLKKRLASYFRSPGPKDIKTRALVQKISDFETILTNTEKEALILEHTLIKKHHPRYNIDLKDGKRYPSLRVDMRVPYPCIEVVRKVKKDGAVYLGPFTSSGAVSNTLKALHKTFPIRKCKQRQPPKRSRPCINFQMGRCLGPCCNEVDPAVYREMVNDVLLFFKGRAPELIKKTRSQMERAAANQDFERAALYRDRMFAMEKTVERQVAVTSDLEDRDVLAVATEPGVLWITILFVRGGRLLGSRHFSFGDMWGYDQAAISAFIRQYYDKDRFVPKEILVPRVLEGRQVLEEWLQEQKGSRVYILAPVRGEKRRLLDMARENAARGLADHLSDEAASLALMQRLQKRLRLDRLPRRVECFDISHTQGEETIASMAVFTNGMPDKPAGRKFIITGLKRADDYAAIRQAVVRRFSGSQKKLPQPDILLLDGGKGQLSMAVQALDELELYGRFAVFGIAKKDEFKGETQDKIFRPGQANPVMFGKDQELLFFLERVRDEAHRLAITHHRKKRAKKSKKSLLDEIPGVGEKRKKALLRHFGSIKRMRQAGVEDLAQARGMNQKVAEQVAGFLSENK